MSQRPLDREGNSKINTGVASFDHMPIKSPPTAAFVRRLPLRAIHIDDHQMDGEDGPDFALGEALKSLPATRGLRQFGFVPPMDECLARCALDIVPIFGKLCKAGNLPYQRGRFEHRDD
ncbi:hypothetical protein KCP78_09620 [Salmonella enterica subsp. enterica]|nr:hypothetical protein KCP78_09620 [Salmonella enterica subsp. enterica]